MALPAPLPLPQGGPAAAPLFNALLHAALAGGAYDALVDALTFMRAGGVEVEPGVAAAVSKGVCWYCWR